MPASWIRDYVSSHGTLPDYLLKETLEPLFAPPVDPGDASVLSLNPVPPVQDQAPAALGGPKVPPGYEAIPSGPDSFVFLDITGKSKSFVFQGSVRDFEGFLARDPSSSPPSSHRSEEGSQVAFDEDADYEALTEAPLDRTSVLGLIKDQLDLQRKDELDQRKEFMEFLRDFRSSLGQPPAPEGQQGPSQLPPSLEALPSVSSTQKVQAWNQGFRIPRVSPPAPGFSPSVAGESAISDSMLAQVSAADVPDLPRPLAEGQSPFDWDHDGAKLSQKDDLPAEISVRLESLNRVAKDMASSHGYPQEPLPERFSGSKVFGMPEADSSPPQVVIPLPEEVKSVIRSARRHKSTRHSLLSPAVRRGYRVPRDDWAFLGAVRRPDKLLQTYCKTKKTSKGVHQLVDAGSSSLATSYHDVIQSTAHALRPASLGFQAAASAHELVTQLQARFAPGSSSELAMALDRVAMLAQYSLTAALDTADCLGRLNSEALRKLRDLWLDKSSLPDSVRDGVKTSPLAPGIAPSSTGVEFTAPLIGDVLKTQHDSAYSAVKSEKLLARKASVFGKPSFKRKGQRQEGGPAKKSKHFSGGPAASRPQRQDRSQRGSRGGRGGKPAGRGAGRGGQSKNPRGRGGKGS